VVHGKASSAGFPTLILYWLQLQQPMNYLGYSYKNIHNSIIDAEKVLKLLMEKSSIKDKEKAVELILDKGEIKFDHVDFTYDVRRETLTLTDITFCVPPGKMVALVGRSGGGKSTVQRLLYRFYDSKSGTISIDDQNIRDVKLQSLRSSIGIVPQVKDSLIYLTSGNITVQ